MKYYKSDTVVEIPEQKERIIDIYKRDDTICKINLTIYKFNRSESAIKKELRDWEAVRKFPNFVFSVRFMWKPGEELKEDNNDK